MRADNVNPATYQFVVRIEAFVLEGPGFDTDVAKGRQQLLSKPHAETRDVRHPDYRPCSRKSAILRQTIESRTGGSTDERRHLTPSGPRTNLSFVYGTIRRASRPVRPATKDSLISRGADLDVDQTPFSAAEALFAKVAIRAGT